MFLCIDCHKKDCDIDHLFTSYGICEDCKKIAICFDCKIHHKELEDKEKPIIERQSKNGVLKILFYKWFDLTNKNAPWNQKNECNEKPGDICCLRASGLWCYEHNPKTYSLRNIIRGIV